MNLKNTLWGSAITTHRGEKFHDNLEDADLMLLNTGDPTYFSPAYLVYSALDITYCSASIYSTTSWRPLKYGTSDHFPMLIINSDPIDIWHWRKKFWKFDEKKLTDFTTSLPPPPPNIMSSQDVELITSFFNETLVSSGQSIFGMGCRRPFVKKGPPWWNAACRKALADRNNARIRLKTHCYQDYIYFKRCVAIAKRVIKAAKRQAWEHFCTNLSHLDALQKVWNRAKNKSKSWNESFPTMTRQDGSTAVTDMEKALALLEPYSSPADLDITTYNLNNAYPISNLLSQTTYDQPITEQELNFALRTAKLGAMGPDLIPYQFLLHLSPPFFKLLLHLFQICFETATIPSAWKNATLLPLLKPGKPPDNPDSYRPIALASCTLKTLEKNYSQTPYNISGKT